MEIHIPDSGETRLGSLGSLTEPRGRLRPGAARREGYMVRWGEPSLWYARVLAILASMGELHCYFADMTSVSKRTIL
jgi:hypothetical protein